VSAEILLTADNSMMSDYRHNEFLGFGTCAPPNFIPDWLYRWLFFPPTKTVNDMPIAAPYGLRKIEAQLLNEGLDVLTVSPDRISKHLDKARILGVHVMDPFGLGPASSTFASVLKKEPFLAQHFRALISNPEIKRAKQKGLKVFIGGPGAWQFRCRPAFVEEHQIDCIVEGEAEKCIGKLFKSALKDEPLPKLYETSADETPSLEEIPDITKPSVNGLVEIGRGCCRGCQFCSVTLRPLRWYPTEKILREVDVNLGNGEMKWACLHAEDVMLYGSKNTLPDDEKLKNLHELVSKKCDGLVWSHCSLAAVAAKPKLFADLAGIILQKQAWWGAEIGIETGSVRLAKKIMPRKAHPFKPEDWPQVVRDGMGLMHDNKLVPAATLIVGSPEETEDDILRTIELVEDLKGVRSLIVPLFFVPMGKLKDKDWFKDAAMTELQKELLIKCMDHGFKWVDELISSSFEGKWYSGLIRPFYKGFAALAKWKVRRAGIKLNTKG